MIRIAATLLFTLFVCYPALRAQTAQDSIKQTINQLFAVMKQADAKSLAALFGDSAVLQTIVTAEGKTTVRNEQVQDFAGFIAKLQSGDADEQIAFDVIRIDDNLAIVWAPYKFYWKGKFSHCGVDSFQLVRMNGIWKIVYLIDTRRKEGCE